MFKKKKEEPGPTPVTTVLRPPWGEEHWTDVAAKIALMNTGSYIEKALTRDGRIHAETYLTVLGALAGFSAQHAIRETLVKTGTMPEHGASPTDFDGGAFVTVGAGGETFYMGDLINSYLFATGGALAVHGPGHANLHSMLGGAATGAGGRPLPFDDVVEIVKRNADVMGTPSYGVPCLPTRHAPHLMPREALDLFWPVAIILLGKAYPGTMDRRLAPAHWPFALNVVIQGAVEKTEAVLDPTVAQLIVLEAAISMSKVDPKRVPNEMANGTPA